MKKGMNVFHSAILSSIADMSSGLDCGRANQDELCFLAAMESAAWRDRLEGAVERDGRSLRDISLAAGLSHGYLHGILRDGKEPTVDRFLKICAELNVSATYVLIGSRVSPATERIVRLLEGDPSARDAVLALLDRLDR